ncbi:hypothetical protein WS63_31680 [Burkholderia stagnalis]|nr:hypothetical protein WS63_31680 [Burkholderia stagnalis]KVO55612.1 hypothetical protein WT18_22910 [Burkholderia stagnalis]KVW97446.1 hypothetical protein WT30_10035 [Burkholderia stagnalis]KWH78490.1 hypothetical protein WT66_15085 [Burkholderia stagnalis]
MQGNDSNASIDDGCPYASITDAREAHQRFHDARAVRQRPAADDDREIEILEPRLQSVETRRAAQVARDAFTGLRA